MKFIIDQSLSKQLLKLKEITGNKAIAQHGINDIDSGFLLVSINREENELELTTTMRSTAAIQANLCLPIAPSQEHDESNACFVEGGKFISFITKHYSSCDSNPSRPVEVTLTFNHAKKNITITHQIITAHESALLELPSEMNQALGTIKNKIKPAMHTINFIPADETTQALYKRSDSKSDHLAVLEEEEFLRALQNTLNTAKLRSHKQAEYNNDSQIYLHQTVKHNLAMYAVSPICRSIEIISIFQQSTIDECFISIALKTASLLAKLAKNTGKIRYQYINNNNHLVFRADNLTLWIQTIAAKRSINDLLPMQTSENQSSADIGLLSKLLEQVLNEDKQHSLITLYRPSAQAPTLEVTAKYQSQLGNNASPETVTQIETKSPFKVEQDYAYNLAAFSHAINALCETTNAQQSKAAQWRLLLVSDHAHVELYIPSKQYYLLTASRH